MKQNFGRGQQAQQALNAQQGLLEQQTRPGQDPSAGIAQHTAAHSAVYQPVAQPLAQPKLQTRLTTLTPSSAQLSVHATGQGTPFGRPLGTVHFTPQVCPALARFTAKAYMPDMIACVMIYRDAH